MLVHLRHETVANSPHPIHDQVGHLREFQAQPPRMPMQAPVSGQSRWSHRQRFFEVGVGTPPPAHVPFAAGRGVHRKPAPREVIQRRIVVGSPRRAPRRPSLSSPRRSRRPHAPAFGAGRAPAVRPSHNGSYSCRRDAARKSPRSRQYPRPAGCQAAAFCTSGCTAATGRLPGRLWITPSVSERTVCEARTSP